MRFVIVTGMSGAGKSEALKIFEDVGFYCVDNLPPSLIGNFADVCLHGGADIEQAAVCTDTRGGKLFEDFFVGLHALDSLGIAYEILFLDASNESLINRYKEKRHIHPLAKNGLISSGIERERILLAEVKQKANHIIDTSKTQMRQFKERIVDLFVNKKNFTPMTVHLLSFGYKYGLPEESDLVFDVRFLPNPFYIDEFKHQTGREIPVREFVMNHDISKRFLNEASNMLSFLIPEYIREGKTYLIIGIGCTGGKHRSVALAEALSESLIKNNFPVALTHRDISEGG
ncbi:MAG: RNase adapter RapZ [Defluviitaleaceae bacterium]|nr:RNase adapter RapZ [Defluviitaleaceae bacterium]